MKASKILAAFMATTLLFTVAGCSMGKSGHSRFPDDDEDTDEEIEEDSDDDSDRDYDRVRTGLGNDWLKGEPWFINENRIEITDPGRFDFPMGNATSGDIRMYSAFITLEENYDDCEAGYKNVVATCKIYDDVEHESMWLSVFDKYTGYTFESSDYHFDLCEGCSDYNYSKKDFKIGDRDVHVEWTFISEMMDNITTFTLIVKCPEDYNGCVFQFRPENSTNNIASCDLDNNLYDINQIGYGSNTDYIYFTIDSKQLL